MSGRWSFRGIGAVLVCGALIAVMAPAASGSGVATARPPHAAPITASFVPFDGPPCPPNPYGYGDGGPEGNYQRIVGIAKTRIGPARFQADICFVFVGAIGGEELSGTFTLKTFAGTLSGDAHGTAGPRHPGQSVASKTGRSHDLGYSESDHYGLTLDVNHGTFLLRSVRGSLVFDTLDAGRDGKDLTGTLTSDLHVSWFGRSFPVPLT